MTSKLLTPARLQAITRQIAAQFHPQQIILFGSYAYGKPRSDSDVDLLVIMDSTDRPAVRSACITRTCRPRYVALDILVRTPAEVATRLAGFDPFIEEILRRGKVLYSAAG